jgi:hypothetical protein
MSTKSRGELQWSIIGALPSDFYSERTDASDPRRAEELRKIAEFVASGRVKVAPPSAPAPLDENPMNPTQIGLTASIRYAINK